MGVSSRCQQEAGAARAPPAQDRRLRTGVDTSPNVELRLAAWRAGVGAGHGLVAIGDAVAVGIGVGGIGFHFDFGVGGQPILIGIGLPVGAGGGWIVRIERVVSEEELPDRKSVV